MGVLGQKKRKDSTQLKREFITGQKEREESTQNTTVTKSAACAIKDQRTLLLVKMEKEKLLQVAKYNRYQKSRAACASYKSNYVTYNCYIHAC